MPKKTMPSEDRNLVPLNDKRVRVPGEKGSVQGALRYKLYRIGWRRIQSGLRRGSYFEVVAICDSIITDRLLALVQTIRHKQPSHYREVAIGNALAAVHREIRDRKIESIPEEFVVLLKEINNDWVERRNVTAHGFVTVAPYNLEKGVTQRRNDLKKAAIDGAKYARKVCVMKLGFKFEVQLPEAR
jgi:hypothetical protein